MSLVNVHKRQELVDEVFRMQNNPFGFSLNDIQRLCVIGKKVGLTKEVGETQFEFADRVISTIEGEIQDIEDLLP